MITILVHGIIAKRTFTNLRKLTNSKYCIHNRALISFCDAECTKIVAE